uniref:Uncharacterized protein n=1 Tax=Moschus moschiferus TaxID=68415 RepID=A0A8C6G3C0_MOSMO
ASSSSPGPGPPVRAAEPREPGFIWDGPFPPPARPRAPGRRDRPDPLPPPCGRSRRRPRAHWPRLRVTSGELKDPFNELLLSTRNSAGADLEGNSEDEFSLERTEQPFAPPPPRPSMQESLLVLGMGCLLPLKTGKLDRPWREKDRHVLAHVHRYTEQRSLSH